MSKRLIAIASLPFLGLSTVVALRISDPTATTLAPTLVGIAVALAIFAVNFSFVAFQLAPYRQLLGGPSRRHLFVAVLLVLLSLAPLLGAICSTKAIGQMAATVTPLLAYGAVLLVALGLAEAEPARVLATRASNKALNRFAQRFEQAVREQIKVLAELDFEADIPSDERLPPPSHEIFHRIPPPPLQDDPIEICVRAVEASVRSDDAAVFVPAVERLLALADDLRTYAYKDAQDVEPWKISAAAATHGEAALRRVAELVSSSDARTVLADRFIEVIARYVREAAFQSRATSEAVEGVFMVGVGTAESQIKLGTQGTGVIGLLLAARKVTDQTLRALGETPDTIEEHNLATYASAVQLIGEAAAKHRNSDLLYRCLETLSWIGCSAVRFGGSETGRRAAGGLVQLGRLARYHELECHWPRCTLTPYQHADERLGWIATWIPQSEQSGQWLNSLGTAFSRLHGYKREMRLKDDAEKPTVELVMPEDAEPHKESFAAEGGERTLDYSNPAVLKDQVLR